MTNTLTFTAVKKSRGEENTEPAPKSSDTKVKSTLDKTSLSEVKVPELLPITADHFIPESCFTKTNPTAPFPLRLYMALQKDHRKKLK